MSILRTIGFCLLATAPAAPAFAFDDPLRSFSDCAGRLSAQMEHQWLMGDPTSDRTEAQRDAMLSLVDAVMSPDQGRDVLTWRIDAKEAHAVLLTRATFNSDAEDAAWARGMATARIASCTGLLLS